jgi:cell division protein FtsL
MATVGRTLWMQSWEKDSSPSAAERRSAQRINARTSSARYYGREATARLPQPLPEAPRAEALTEVQVYTRRRPRWGLVLLMLCLAGLLLGAAVICPVLLSSAATDVEAAVGRMEAQKKDLTQAGTTLSAQISALSSPERVAEEANKLGLQPASSVHYLQVDAGTAVAEGATTVAGR